MRFMMHLIACLFLFYVKAFEPEDTFNSIRADININNLPFIIMMKEKPLLNVNPNQRREYEEQLTISHIESMSEASVDPISDCTNHYFYSINGYSAFMTEEQSQIIAQQPNVKSVSKDSFVSIETDASPQFLELTSYPNGAYINGINGEGVVVGILDTGIWPEHPSFVDNNYPPPPTKIPSSIPCNFGNTEFNPDDTKFECNNKIIGARRCMDTYDAYIDYVNFTYVNGTFLSARDDNSHGTHVASTAIGNSNVESYNINPLVKINFGKVSGIAPRAHVIAYKIFGFEGGFDSDVAKCIDYATMDKVDVLNYSGGGGIHTYISSSSEAAFFEAVKQGIFAINSAGNRGSALGTMWTPAGDPWLCTVAASTQQRWFNAKIRIKEMFHTKKYKKYNKYKKYKKYKQRNKLTISNGIGIIPTSSVALTKSQWVPLINGASCDNLNAESANGKIVLCKNNVFTSLGLMDRVREVNGLGVIFWSQSVVNKQIFFRQAHDMLFATVQFEEGQKIERYINESIDMNNVFIKVVNRINKFDSAPSIASFSSRGPNRAAFDIIKPDITAPGVKILAGISPNNYYRFIPPYRNNLYELGQLFSSKDGTSMSAPHIAGVGALIKQFHPNWGPDFIKSAIMTTAYQDDIVDSDLETEADIFDYGSGHVNPGDNFNSNAQSIINPGLVYPVTENDYNSALCENTTAFTPDSDVCDELLDQGYTNLFRDLNQPNIGAMPFNDVVTVRRYVVSVASGTNRFKVHVKKPNGIEVIVSPTILKLSENERGNYTVTFSVTPNTILDEFHFGYLVWKTDIYNVYSAIAVYPDSS